MKMARFAAVALVGLMTAAGTAQADPVNGPQFRATSVAAFSTDVYHLMLYGREVTQIIVDGDGDTDLDLFVYDQNGNLVASDTGGTDYCVAYVTPLWTGMFRIEVVNIGPVHNNYTIRVR